MAQTTTSLKLCTSMAFNHPPTWSPQMNAQHLAAKVSALPCATMIVRFVSRSTSGRDATCLGSASTWQTWLRSLIDIARSQRGREERKCIAW